MTQRVRIQWDDAHVSRGTRRGAARAVRLAAEHVLAESRKSVPIEEGTLERSGVVSVDESSLTAAISYDTPYAVRQHEDLTLRHDAGRTPKYLEGPLVEERVNVREIMAAQLRRSLRG